MTSNITSTCGTFPLYLITPPDEWGISLGGGFLWGARAVVVPPPLPAAPALLAAWLSGRELQTATARGSDGALAQKAPLHSSRTLSCQKTQLCNLLHSHVFHISQSCYWSLGFFSCLNNAVNLYSTLNDFFLCNNICHCSST